MAERGVPESMSSGFSLAKDAIALERGEQGNVSDPSFNRDVQVGSLMHHFSTSG